MFFDFDMIWPGIFVDPWWLQRAYWSSYMAKNIVIVTVRKNKGKLTYILLLFAVEERRWRAPSWGSATATPALESAPPSVSAPTQILVLQHKF